VKPYCISVLHGRDPWLRCETFDRLPDGTGIDVYVSLTTDKVSDLGETATWLSHFGSSHKVYGEIAFDRTLGMSVEEAVEEMVRRIRRIVSAYMEYRSIA